MQHTNDDIDELYRNAADNYPLKIKGADWDSIAGRLGSGGIANAPVTPFTTQKPGKNYKYLLLLLLLPAGFFAAKYSGLTGSTQTPAQQSIAKTGSETSAASPGNNKAQGADGNTTAAQPASQTDLAAASASSSNNTTADNSIQQPASGKVNTTAPYGQPSERGKVKNMKVTAPAIADAGQPTETNISVTPMAVPPLSQLGALNKKKEISEQLNNLYSSAVPGVPTVVRPGADKTVPGNNTPVTTAQTSSVTAELVKHSTAAAPSAATKTGDDGNGTGGINEPVKKPTRKHLYVGAFVAPDYTTIKYQPGDKVGFNFGGLVGYTFSRNLSLEVGVALDKKYYSSDGKYYNTANQKWIESAGKLLTISGYSSLTEFPVNVVYSFKPGRDGNFFVSGGLVSYIVHEENYNYEFDKNGFIYHREKSTKKGTTNAFANFSISAGYESSLGHGINFRVEPYYRIPIKGIGLGGLPITSVGLNIGITKMIK